MEAPKTNAGALPALFVALRLAAFAVRSGMAVNGARIAFFMAAEFTRRCADALDRFKRGRALHLAFFKLGFAAHLKAQA